MPHTKYTQGVVTLRYRYRAYPTRGQEKSLARLLGCCRVVFNDAVAAREAAHANGHAYPTRAELSAALAAAKHTTERHYLTEVSAVPLQQVLADVESAYRNFFASLKGERRRAARHPKFRSRSDRRQAARFTKNARFSVETRGRDGVCTLPKIGPVRFVCSRELPSTPSSVTVIREADGRYYLSFVVQVAEQAAEPNGSAVGIDVGLSAYVTMLSQCGDSEQVAKVASPLYLRRRERALKRSQRSLCRKQKGSKNREKQRRRVAVSHRKVREARLDHAHKVAASIVDAHDVICVEDVNVAAMAKSRLAKSIADQGIGQFLRLLEEKAERRGRHLVRVGRFFPSTQLCSSCTAPVGPKGQQELGVRHWTCRNCGVSHDRDVNAARNILTEGLRLLAMREQQVADGQSETINARGADVRQGCSPAVGREAGRNAGDLSCVA